MELLRHYANQPDLREELQRVAVILAEGGQDDGVGTENTPAAMRSPHLLRDRLYPDDLQAMIDLYKSSTPAKQVAEKYGVSLSSIKRLLRRHGVRREAG